MRWLGGIPVQRDRSNRVVTSTAAALRAALDPLQLVVAPEGTRSRTAQWKTGFHRIAWGANLPIQLSYLDWEPAPPRPRASCWIRVTTWTRTWRASRPFARRFAGAPVGQFDAG